LDQLADKPTPEESIWVYQLRDGGTARGMVCSRGQGCRTVIVADYDWLNEQPDDETLRDQDQWRAWASAQVGRRADASDEGPH
jgi:hypothetical protein